MGDDQRGGASDAVRAGGRSCATVRLAFGKERGKRER
jgi:hypothetical protein